MKNGMIKVEKAPATHIDRYLMESERLSDQSEVWNAVGLNQEGHRLVIFKAIDEGHAMQICEVLSRVSGSEVRAPQ